MSDEKKYLPIPIPLEESRDLDGQPVSKLTMRPPQATDLFAAERAGRGPEGDLHLFANLTGTTVEFIQSLSVFDYKKVERAYGLFMLPIPLHLEKRSSFCPEPPAADPSTTSVGSQ